MGKSPSVPLFERGTEGDLGLPSLEIASLVNIFEIIAPGKYPTNGIQPRHCIINFAGNILNWQGIGYS